MTTELPGARFSEPATEPLALKSNEGLGPAPWDDAPDSPVRQIYDLLCDAPAPPTPDEHWEGWLARLIVGRVLLPAVAAERERLARLAESLEDSAGIHSLSADEIRSGRIGA